MDKTWMDKPIYTTTKNLETIDIPKIWKKCASCNLQVMISELDKNLYICTDCNNHFTLPFKNRISLLTDEGSFKELFKNYKSLDPLKFNDGNISYLDKIKASQKKTNFSEAVITGKATLDSRPIILAIMIFEFIGGSMGSVVGEKIYQSMQLAIKTKSPLIIVTTSGGARMQEGLLSLMQMAKTCMGVQELDEKKIPFITILTNPTMGGVTASFASVADVIIAEPNATIGFAGRRVIEDTIKEKLPEKFQTTEYLYEKGFIDMIVPRNEMREKLVQLLNLLS